jgi:hypothetical protein
VHWLLLLLVLLGSSCTSERLSAPAQSAQGKPSPSAVTEQRGDLSLAITPTDANRKATLTLAAKGFSGQQTRVIWYVDGSPASSSESGRFDCSGLVRGDTVRAVAVVQGREVRSNEVTIGDTPPELSDVAFQPAQIGQNETLEVSASASDADNDPVVIQYVWTVNGVLAGNGPRLDRPTNRGDAVRVEVTANDGLMNGDRVVLNQTIANRPPVFIEDQNYSFSGNTFVYQARATDVDGDRIVYGLDGAAEGMTIDANSGKVTWSAPPDFRGDQPVTITADDGHGGVARYTLTFTLK